jgi:glycerol-3-phosphate acyltransferase PlsY
MAAAESATITGVVAISYVIGSIPFAYIIVRLVTGEDITAHGTGNVGAMNVRRSTGRWGWFVLALIADALKGIIPTFGAKLMALGATAGACAALEPWGLVLADSGLSWWTIPLMWLPMAAVAGSVLGHNYSVWMAIMKRTFHRTGKGLATGGGALLAYDWRYFIAVLVVGLGTIALTRYMMAGQVAAAITLPITALALGSPDWPFALLMGLLVYAAHHKRFVGMLQGREPKLYVDDRMGPRG